MLSAGRIDPSRPSGKLGDEPGSEGDLKAGVRGHMAEAATKGTIEADADADAARVCGGSLGHGSARIQAPR